MRFDANRLAVLAGLPKGDSGLIKESVDEVADLGLFEDEGMGGYAMEGEDEGHHPPPMEEGEHDGTEENMHVSMEEADEAHCNEDGPDEYGSMMREAADEDDDDDVDDDDVPVEDEGLNEMVTVDEEVLRREIMAMKQQRLAENKIRQAVREEIASILSEEYDDDNLYLTSDWLYGDNKPTNSRKGAVATALPGIGFKKV